MMNKIIEWLYLHQSNNLVYNDKLTHLLNRNWWEIYAKEKLNNKKFYLIVIDIDNFKATNDIQGHTAGDKLLIYFSAELKKYFPSTKICRLGGDEFVVLCEEYPLNYILDMEEANKDKIKFSFGVVLKSKEMSLTEALEKADRHMYQMKYSHKHCK